MKVTELDTPALIVDLDVMEDNLRRMADYCRDHGLSLRPHAKTHKSPLLAQRQIDMGAEGITVAKVGEAEVMSEAGLDDLLLAYPVVGRPKARRLREVLEHATVSVSLDSEEAVHWVAMAAENRPVDVLVEIDFGMRRCGVLPGDEPLRLARAIEAESGLRFKGIMLYSGHLQPDLDGSTRGLQRLNADLARQLELFQREGFQVEVVSGGTTPSAYYSHLVENLTEIRPGTYIFNDRSTVQRGACTQDQCAAFLLTTVVSTAVPGQAIIDGGSKTFAADADVLGDSTGYGIVIRFPEIEFVRMNEEHGYLQLGEGIELRVGQQLRVIPNHVCAATNLHDRVWGMRRDEVVEEWEVAARGRIR